MAPKLTMSPLSFSIFSEILEPAASAQSRREIKLHADVEGYGLQVTEFTGEVARESWALGSHMGEVSISAPELLAEALAGLRHMDFPMVTSICERACGDCQEMSDLVELVVASLEKPDDDLAVILKALTVAHELLYDDNACLVLLDAPGFLQALQSTKLRAVTAAQPGPAAESVGLLSAELWRRLQECERRRIVHL
jgi:hypothetical protein